MKGKIILVPFPFTDLSGSKLRPALVLFETGSDVVVAFISSQLMVNTYGVTVGERHSDYPGTGLKVSSTIRLDKVATLHRGLIEGEIGEVGGALRKEVNDKLADIYRL